MIQLMHDRTGFAGKIHAGFSAYRGIYLGQQGCRNLDKRNPTQVRGGGKAGHIPGDAAPERHGEIGAGQAELGEGLQHGGDGRKIFALLSGGEYVKRYVIARGFQRGLYCLGLGC